jgi:glycosyltransferase involved in cell wall biosynthesis
MSGGSQSGKRAPIPVLLLVRKLDHGGIERDVTKVVKGLDRSRFTPYVAVYQSGGLRIAEVQQAGVPILNLQVTSLISPRILRSARNFCRFIKRNKIRIVHAYDASAVFAAPLARLMKVPFVLSSTLGHRDLFDERTRKQLPFTDRLVDTVFVNCEAMRRHMMDDYGVPRERTVLCYNGVETSEFFPNRSGEPKPDPVAGATLVIGALCVLRPEKRMDLLVEAFGAVHGLRPGVKLLIVGSGPELPKLQAKAVELGIEKDCVFMPAVPKVAPLLRAMDIFVSCSSSEAFSNAVLEAMACGCCPVGSRVGGTPELIADGGRGLLFESGSAQELAAKLALLIENDEMRLRLAHNAATFATENLNMDVALNCISEIYETGLAKKEGRAI